MSTILDTIAGHTRFRVAEKKKKLPFEELRARALDLTVSRCGSVSRCSHVSRCGSVSRCSHVNR